MSRSGDNTKRRRQSLFSRLSWLDALDPPDAIEFLIYGALGFALLIGMIYVVGRAAWANSSLLFGSFMAAVFLTAGTMIRDAWQRRLSFLTKGFLAAWLLCVLYLVILDIVAA